MYCPSFPDHRNYQMYSKEVDASLVYCSSSSFARQGKNSTFSGEVQAKVKGYERLEGLRVHMSQFLGKQVPLVVLGDHMGVEETILRSKPPLDMSLSAYVAWLREWVCDSGRWSGYCPTKLMLADAFTKPLTGPQCKPLVEALRRGKVVLPLCMSGGRQPPEGYGWEPMGC